jgi:hypothetical protein
MIEQNYFFRECAFQPFLVLVQHHHSEQNVAEHVAAHIICIYIYSSGRSVGSVPRG